jgi:hypothetical protein
MSAAKRKLRLVKLKKYNTIWHPDSTLVFKSQKERFVIGRLVDKELVPLDDEAIELAEQWKLKIDESLLESESEEKDSEEGSDDGSNDENYQEEDSQGEENTQEEEESHEDEQSQEEGASHEDEQSQEEGASHAAHDDENLVEVAKEEDNLQLKESEKSPKALTVDTSFKDNELTNEIMQNARKTVDLIIGLETKLEIVSKEKTELQTSYDDLKEKYDAIMNKFNTMKSLFA